LPRSIAKRAKCTGSSASHPTFPSAAESCRLVERTLRAVQTSGLHVGECQQAERSQGVEAQSGSPERGDRLGVLRACVVEPTPRFSNVALELEIHRETPEISVPRMERCRTLGLLMGRLPIAECQVQLREVGPRPRFDIGEARDLRAPHRTLQIDSRGRKVATRQS
jgi:hypothetical protein